MTTQDAIELRTLRARIKNHPLCFNFIDNATHVGVHFGRRIGGIDGLQVQKAGPSYTDALDFLLMKLEEVAEK